MCLEEKRLSKKLVNYGEICQFMKRVFPKEERMPMWLIRILILKKNYDFQVYYDKGVFVGILFTIQSAESVFVFYIAVNDALHSKGYGSMLLQTLFNKYSNTPITLFIETMQDKKADNYTQRVKRLAFYKRNGFIQTGLSAGYKKPFVDILSTDENYDIIKAKRLVKWMAMNIFS